MKNSKEIIEEIQNAESLDALKQKAKDNNIDIDEKQLAELYEKCHTTQLSDDELDNVTGGCGDMEIKTWGLCDNFSLQPKLGGENNRCCYYCAYSYKENSEWYCRLEEQPNYRC